MATGAKPALDPNVKTQAEGAERSDTKPTTFVQKIIHQLTKIFEHNERLGVTRE